MNDTITRAEDTVLDAIGRSRHTLNAMHDPGTAIVTVHGRCPLSECRAMNVVEVHADTTSFTCSDCNQTFDC